MESRVQNQKLWTFPGPLALVLCAVTARQTSSRSITLHLHPVCLQQVHERPAPPTKPLPPDPALNPPAQVKCGPPLEVCVCALCCPVWCRL